MWHRANVFLAGIRQATAGTIHRYVAYEHAPQRSIHNTKSDLSYFIHFSAGHGADADPALLNSAVDYVKIRALSMPTSLLLAVLQSACLGAKDSVTPLIAILYATIVNLLGDFLLVKVFSMGLRGAAIATLLAQWASTVALLGPVRRRLVRDHSLGLWKKPPVTEDSVTGRNFLAFAAPVLTLILGKLAAFGFMTHSAAAVPGQPTPLASHQIILSLFFFVSPFMEVISQTAQTFIPSYLAPVSDHIAKRLEADPKYKPDNDEMIRPWKKSAFTVGNSLMKLGFCMAIAVASAASLVPAYFGGILTSDAGVISSVKPLAKYLWMGAFLTGPVAVSEGILLANRELKYLALTYLVSTALLPSALLRVKSIGGNVEQIWACFAVFQLFRAVCFAGRVWTGPALGAVAGLLGKKKVDPAASEAV
jgi:Na+-driven multidrug efflux pump